MRSVDRQPLSRGGRNGLWHVLREDDGEPRCNRDYLGGESIPAVLVEPYRRCPRQGCRQAWPVDGSDLMAMVRRLLSGYEQELRKIEGEILELEKRREFIMKAMDSQRDFFLDRRPI
jgi:hypothetical protein